MLKKILVRELIEDGKALLDELDRAGFPVLSAFWVDLREDPMESHHWRLVLSSPDVDAHGPMAAYRAVQRVLGRMKTSALSFDDISVLSPNDQNYQNLRELAAGPGRLGMELHGSLGSVIFEDSIIYRLSA